MIPTTYTFAISRFVSGISAGIAVLIVPLYLAEISPDEIRGKISMLFVIELILGSVTSLAIGIPLGFGINPLYWLFAFSFPFLLLSF